uniref:AlNc14C196G8574 protein n=1 Tax=Albugo laibachii Nc14 TaxID=890382 RepID=F0WQ93_9STRA|nr:AlNc14C196G8574 [Albugo laibachii Nc14]|eukprot:CCA23499.1 AlNc14C196G8574 [Albugo laibachii Nc14]
MLFSSMIGGSILASFCLFTLSCIIEPASIFRAISEYLKIAGGHSIPSVLKARVAYKCGLDALDSRI